MPKQITVTAYTFDELNDKAKDKAREWMRRCVGEDYAWADSITDDAANVGLKITGWNLDRGASCELSFEDSEYLTAKKIVENHGDTCDTYQAAQTFLSAKRFAQTAYDADDISSEAADDLEVAAIDTFKKALQAAYLDMLRKQWEYALSDESIDEGIQANEYLFTEAGSRCAVL